MKKIIIADNVTSVLEEEKNALSRATCSVFTATSNEEALAIHRAEKASLIITKLDMPGLNGDELCAAIRQDAELSGVSILLICIGTDGDIVRCRSCGANGYLPPPSPSTGWKKPRQNS